MPIEKNKIKLAGVYFGWLSTHYITSHLYTLVCTPLSIKGFIQSAFNTATPHCSALRWCIYQGAETINNAWLFLGLWIISQIKAN